MFSIKQAKQNQHNPCTMREYMFIYDRDLLVNAITYYYPGKSGLIYFAVMAIKQTKQQMRFM